MLLLETVVEGLFPAGSGTPDFRRIFTRIGTTLMLASLQYSSKWAVKLINTETAHMKRMSVMDIIMRVVVRSDREVALCLCSIGKACHQTVFFFFFLR